MNKKHIQILNNHDIYNFLLKTKEIQTPIGLLKWKSYLTQENTILAYETLKFIFKFLDDNKYKIFR